jgi:outer membrane protein OmpA-like peptidoglycan-associated protein
LRPATAIQTLADGSDPDAEALRDAPPPTNRVIATYDQVIIPKIEFKLHSAALADSIPVLDAIIALMAKRPDLVVEIQGHADSSEGKRATRLAEQRAIAVRDRMVKHGVREEQLVVKGYGAEQPVALPASEEGKKVNPRVTFRLLSSDGGGP